ncbi:MAG: type II toxin-antitoxin system RelE family toxin [Wolbachia sp.]
MEYNIIYLDNVLEEDLPGLPKKIQSRIIDAIDERLKIDPINLGEPLYHSFKGFRRLRVGDYRAMYHADTEKYEVTIITVGHRDNFYEKALKIIKKYFQ